MTSKIDFDDFYTLRNFRSKAGEPPLEILEFLPTQGNWTEEEYMLLLEKRGLEYTDGFLEILPNRTTSHQLTAGHLICELGKIAEEKNLGRVSGCGIRLRLPGKKYREPDVIFVSQKHVPKMIT